MDTETTAADWKNLYRLGGAAALIVVGLWSVEIGGAIVMGPLPATVIGWFTLYKNYGLLGLLDSFLLDVVALVFMILVFLALYRVLRRTGAPAMAVATTLMFVGITLSFTTNATLSMLDLSSQYAMATTEAQRTLSMAAGQAVLDIGQRGTGSTLAYLLQGIAGLIISAVMLRSNTFGKVTAYTGLLANGLQVIQPPVAFVPATFYAGMGLGVVLILASFVFYVIWYLRIAGTLFRLGRTPPNEADRGSRS